MCNARRQQAFAKRSLEFTVPYDHQHRLQRSKREKNVSQRQGIFLGMKPAEED